MSNIKKEDSLTNHDWRVSTNDTNAISTITELFKKLGKTLENSLIDGYVHGNPTEFYVINMEIAEVLSEKHSTACLIQHRPHREGTNTYSWSERRTKNKKLSGGWTKVYGRKETPDPKPGLT